ncbi:MAG: gephyrin-like molybdotransferase Glp [Pseudomonadota bacterium]
MNDCEPSDSRLLSYDEALQQLLAAARPLDDSRAVPLAQALGQVTARGVTSALNVPPADNSAMDGYALRAADLITSSNRLPVSQRIAAGTAPAPLAAGTAARIFTGAPIPEGADTVVIQESCTTEGNNVVINTPPGIGANIRRTGEDINEGDEIIAAGVRLEPQHLGLAASVGVAELDVRRPLRVALFSTGDELVLPGEPLAPGKIYNSNLFTATGLITALGCEPVSLGIVEDSFEGTCAALEKAAAQADLILASGGVSVGEEDYVKPAVEALGSLDLWKIAIRPGKPVAFGQVHGTPVIGAPGNPVSLFVTFLLFARPFILAMQGRTDPLPRARMVHADFERPRPDKRRDFARARIRLDDEGRPWAYLHRSRSSGVLSSVAWASGLAIVREGRTYQKGDRVEYLDFGEMMR